MLVTKKEFEFLNCNNKNLYHASIHRFTIIFLNVCKFMPPLAGFSSLWHHRKRIYHVL